MSIPGYIILSVCIGSLMYAWVDMGCDECIGTAGIVTMLLLGMILIGTGE